jgi:hypothetical protein
MKKIVIFAFALTISMGPVLADAHSKGIFTINVDNEAAFGSSADSLVATLDGYFKEAALKKTIKYMADSMSTAPRGQGATYATNQEIFVLSASGNMGFSPGKRTIFDFIQDPFYTETQGSGIPEMGLAGDGDILLGVSLKAFHLKSLGFIDPSRFVIFINFFTFSYALPTYSLQTNSFGIHAQYKLIDQSNIVFGLVHWGGLDITTGLDIADNTLAMPMPNFFKKETSGTIEFVPAGDLKFINKTLTIPIEVSTNIRLGYAITFIAGGAVDINTGTSQLDIGKSNITSGGIKVGELSINEKGKANAGFFDLRFFIGPQINLIPLSSGKNILSITALLNVTTSNTYGAKVSLNAGF